MADDASKIDAATTPSVDEIGAKIRAEMERKFSKREAEIRSSAVDAWRAEQGFDDEAIEKLRSKESEATKSEKRAALAEKRAADAEKRAESHAARLRRELTQTAVMRAAGGKSVDPDAVWLIVRDRVSVDDEFGVVVLDDAGKPSGKSVNDFVDALLKEKPYLAVPRGKSGGGGGAGGAIGETSESGGNGAGKPRTQEQIRDSLLRAKAEGRI